MHFASHQGIPKVTHVDFKAKISIHFRWKKNNRKTHLFSACHTSAALRVSLYKKSIIFNGWQRLFQEKRNIQNLFISLFFSSYSEHVCRVWKNTNIEKRSKEEKKIRRKMKRSSSPSLSSPKPQKFFWEDCISLCFINLIVQQLVRQCSQTPFMSVLAHGGRGIALLRQLSCTRN